MGLEIHLFPCLSDNYGILIRDRATGLAATVDTPDAAAILAEAEKLGWRLAMVLNTHWHPDHAGGNQAVKDATGAEIVGPDEVTRIAPLDRRVTDCDVVLLGETRLEVLDTQGHTNGHVSYHAAADRAVFVGDTLFALGCGRLFEGTPQTMWRSLSRLAALPDDTQVWCAHEYTASNARFALSVDSDPQVAARCEAVFAARAEGRPTVPTTIGLEKATNPFLRAPLLAGALGAFSDAAEAFGLVRAAKDAFRG
jgi:hydroxyacylglutathione hydrolase